MSCGGRRSSLRPVKGGLLATRRAFDEVEDFRREAQALKAVVAAPTLENRLLKKRMARPVCKGFDRERRKISLLQHIRPRRVSPGHDGDTRAPVLIKPSA